MHNLTHTEKILVITYIMILPSLAISMITMNGDIIIYSLGICGLAMCINGVVEDTKSK